MIKDLDALVQKSQEELYLKFDVLKRCVGDEINSVATIARNQLLSYILEITNKSERPLDRYIADLKRAEEKKLAEKPEEEQAIKNVFAAQIESAQAKYSKQRLNELLRAKQAYLDYSNILRNTYADLGSAIAAGSICLNVRGSGQMHGLTSEAHNEFKDAAIQLQILMIYAETLTDKEVVEKADDRLARLGYEKLLDSYNIRKVKIIADAPREDILLRGESEVKKLIASDPRIRKKYEDNSIAYA